MFLFSLLPALLFLIPIMVGIALLFAQRQLIRRHSRGRFILPVVVTAVSIALLLANSFASSDSFAASIRSYYFSFDDTAHGEMEVYYDHNTKAVKGIGQLIVNPGEHAQYIDLIFRDGELIAPEKIEPYRAELEEALGSDLGDFTGSSLLLGELQGRYEADRLAAKERGFHADAALTALPFFCILPVALWCMYFIDLHRREVAKQLTKLKLEDL